jgi:5-methylcytosine-specific restriction endonuclease McrA
MAKFLFQKGNKFRQGIEPWNKGTKGVCKSNSGTFKMGEKHHNKPHSEETKNKISKQFKKRWGEGCYEKRPTHSEETRDKIRNTLRRGEYIKCIVCKNEIWVSPSNIDTKFCSHECQGKFYSGSNNLNWKGGVSKIHPYKHYRNKEYLGWRKQVFERDNYVCQNCFTRGGYLEPHHIKSYTRFPEFRYELSNGQTLCLKCHRLIHKNNRR